MENNPGQLLNRTCPSDDHNEKKMKEKLIDMGIYEPGMTSKEMNEFLQAIMNSSETSNSSENKPSPTIHPTIIYSNSNTFSGATNSTWENRRSDNLESSMSPGCTYSNKLAENLATNTQEESKYVTLEKTRIRNHIEDDNNYLQSSNPNRKLLNPLSKLPNNYWNISQTVMLRNQIDISGIDPLDCKTVDIPLKSRRSSKLSAMSRIICIINGSIQIPKGEVENMNRHLQEVADAWNKWETQNTGSQFRWGAPIKVRTDNGSLDNNAGRTRDRIPDVTELLVKTEIARKSEESDIVILRSNPFRKARSSRKREDPYDYDDIDGDVDFIIKEKKVKMDTFLEDHLTNKKRIPSPASRRKKPPKKVTTDNNGAPEWHKTRRRRKTEKKRELSPEYDFVALETASKKIVMSLRPLRTRSCNTVGQLKNNSLGINESTRMQSPGKSMETAGLFTLPKKLIAETLNEDGIAEVSYANDIEERFPEISESFFHRSNRLDTSITHLQREGSEREMWVKNKKYEEKLRIEREECEKTDKLRQKVKASKVQAHIIEAMEVRKKEREQHYRHVINKAKPSSIRTEIISDGDLIRAIEGVNWDSRTGNQVSSENSRKNNEVPKSLNRKIGCPICGKFFGVADIQDHAAICMDFPVDNNNQSYVEGIIGKTPSPNVTQSHVNDIDDPHVEGNFHDHEHDYISKSRISASGSNSQSSMILSDSPIRSIRTISDDQSAFHRNQFQWKKTSGRTPKIENGERKRSANHGKCWE